MIRFASIALLFISVFFMIRGISETWKNRTLPASTVSSKQPAVAQKLEDDIVFNPALPPTPPDFKEGYLFNQQRALEEEKEPEAPPEEENLAGNDLGIQTNINETTFSGAIIADTFKKAIITYTPAPEPSAAANKGKSSRISRSKRRSAPKASRGALQTTQLSEGDLISGYKVASIEPDKIVFSKDGESIEKFIYDPNKKRAQPVARAKPATLAPPRPVPGGTGAAIAPPAGSPLATSQSPNTRQQGGATAQARTPATVTARRPSTARRLVVSRKPPPKPDTSRVSRRRRSAGGSAPTSPAGFPGVPPTMNR